MFFPWAAPASLLRAIKFILNVNSSYSFEKFTPEAAFWRRGQDSYRISTGHVTRVNRCGLVFGETRGETEFWRENSTTESSSPSSTIDYVRVRHCSFFCHSGYALSLFSVLLNSLLAILHFHCLVFVLHCVCHCTACQHGEVI